MDRARSLLAASALLAALALGLRPPPLIGLPAACWLLGLLPGLLVARALPGAEGRSPECVAGNALALGLGLGMVLAVAGMWRPLPQPLFAGGLGLVGAGLALALRPRPASRPAADAGAMALCLGIGALVAVPLVANPVVRRCGDALFHSQIVYEILTHGLPPRDPSFFDQPLAYAWALHAWMAAVARLAGTSPYPVFPIVAFLATTTLAFAFLRLARRAGLHGRTALGAVMVLLCAMNALGFFQATLQFGLAPILHPRGDGRSLSRWLDEAWVHPHAWSFASAVVYRGHHVLSSLLNKFVSINTVAMALALAAAAHVAGLAQRREGGGANAWLTAALTAGAALVHPVVGMSAACASSTAFACALLAPGDRRRGKAALLAVCAGALCALAPLLGMLAAPLHGGERTRIGPYGGNVFALAQALAVSGGLSLAGWRRAWRRDPGEALAAAGYTAAAVAVCGLVRFPSDAFAYPGFVAYLGTAWLLPHGIGAIASATASRPAARALARAALALVPVTTVMLLLVILRERLDPGLCGYPESADEHAVFERLRRTPAESVVIDTQNFEMSAAAGYSARRTWFGGMAQVRIVGYPEAEMLARERAIRDLMFDAATSDTTWSLLDRLGPSVYVVARRAPSGGMVFDTAERPAADPIAKLDALPERVEPVVRTATIALYRYRAGVR